MAAIFLSYNLVGASDGAGVPSALIAWLWLPWVALAIVGASLVPRALDAPGFDPFDRSAWLGSLAATLVIVGAEQGVAYLGVPEGPNASNLLVVGAIALGLVIVQRFRSGTSVWPGVLGGAVLAVASVGLPMLAESTVVRGLLAAGLAALVFLGIGLAGLATLDRA